MMIGICIVCRSQPTRPAMDKHIISSLQQHGSQPLSSPAPQSQPSATLASLVSMGSRRVSTQPSAEIARSSTLGEGTESAVKQPQRPSAEIVRSQPIGEGVETVARQAQNVCTSHEGLQHNPWICDNDLLGDGKLGMSGANSRVQNHANALMSKAMPVAEGDEHDTNKQSMIQAGSHSASCQMPTVSQQQQQQNQSLQQQQLSHRSSARSDAQAAAVQKQLGLPMPVSHVEADRDFVLLGAAAIMEGVEAEQAKARRLCIR